jgi:hypothetical protein
MTARTPMRRPGNRTAAELGATVGRSARTVRRHIAQPRAEYEAQSLARSKPWEAEGISRMTWYRRRKVATQSR